MDILQQDHLHFPFAMPCCQEGLIRSKISSRDWWDPIKTIMSPFLIKEWQAGDEMNRNHISRGGNPLYSNYKINQAYDFFKLQRRSGPYLPPSAGMTIKEMTALVTARVWANLLGSVPPLSESSKMDTTNISLYDGEEVKVASKDDTRSLTCKMVDKVYLVVFWISILSSC